MQQRWRYADDELAPGEGLSLDALAHDVTLLPDSYEGSPDKAADDLLDFFSSGRPAAGGVGGSIEPVSLETPDDDGVLMAEASKAERAASP